MATPVLADLRYAVADLSGRLARAGGRLVEDRRTRLRAAARGLPARPEDLLALPQQRLDLAGSKLGSGLLRNVEAHRRDFMNVAGRLGRGLLDRAVERRSDRLEAVSNRLGAGLRSNAAAHEQRLIRVAARLSPQPLHRGLDQRAARLDAVGHRLDRWPDALKRETERLSALARALSGLDPAKPKPGFARVEDSDGGWITQAAGLSAGQSVNLIFPDGTRGARIDGEGTASAVQKVRPAAKPKPVPSGQGDLF